METGRLRGALFSTFLENSVTNQTNKTKKSLQAYGKKYDSINPFFHRIDVSLKRASLRWSVGIKAMVSIEAAIAIPVFLFAFLEIISLLQCLSTYSGTLYRMKETIEPISMYANALQALSIDLEEASFMGVELDRKRDFVAARVQYEMNPVIPLVGLKIPMENYFFLRLWTGYDQSEENLEGYVYITKTGNVYHTFRDCSHLTLSITSIPKAKIEMARNESGERYVNCPMCLEIVEKEERLEYFYITRTGNKYHGNITCAALKRTVLCVLIEEVEDRALCKRCEKRSGE